MSTLLGGGPRGAKRFAGSTRPEGPASSPPEGGQGLDYWVGDQGLPNFLLALNDRRAPPPPPLSQQNAKKKKMNFASSFPAFWTHSKCSLSSSV